MTTPGNEIVCTVCGADTLVVRQPVYEGFTRVGDAYVCAACGHRYEQEDQVPFKTRAAGPAVFDESDRSPEPNVFASDEHKRLCRYCAHYVVNPFTQWCHVHRREVEATDTCDRFEPRDEAAGEC